MRHTYELCRYYPGKGYTTCKRYYFNSKLAALPLLQFFKFIDLFRETHVNPSNGYRYKAYSVDLWYIPKYSVDTDLGIDWQDAGPWRSYQLTASGDNLSALLKDAYISEIDQDGGDLDNYSLKNCDGEVWEKSVKLLEKLTGEEFDATEYSKNLASEIAEANAKAEALNAARKAEPCKWCGDLKGDDWYYMGELCRDCHGLYLDELHSHCDTYSGGCNKPIENRGYQRRCEDCQKAALEYVSRCGVCGLDKPGAGEYYFKLPDAGLDGSDIEEFCCKECASNPIEAYLKGRRRRA